MAAKPLVEARRFLHCCYCCVDSDRVARFFADGFGMRTTMQTKAGRSDGSLLRIDGVMTTMTRFVFDPRGPRVSPAIEVQEWIDPPLTGELYPSAEHVGFHAVGVAVPDLDVALAHLETLAAPMVGEAATGGSAVFGASRAAVVRAPEGVLVDLVEDERLASTGSTQFHHLRFTCSDLDASIAWYEMVGFELLARDDDVEPPPAPFAFDVSTSPRLASAQLRLPDEPFRLLLHEWRTPASTGRPYPVANHRGMYRAAICVDDTRAAYEQLGAAGFVFDDVPTLVEMHGTPVPDMWIVFMRDPDGFPVELVERPRSAFK